jgi:hypothetical protein
MRQVRGDPMIALFDDPPRITFSSPVADSRNGLLFGFAVVDGSLEGVALLEDGSVTLVTPALFRVDFRYDVETDRWIDVAAQNADQRGSEPDQEG